MDRSLSQVEMQRQVEAGQFRRNRDQDKLDGNTLYKRITGY